MKRGIEFKNFQPEAGLVKLIGRLVGKLERKAKRFPPDGVFLRLMVERNPARTLYHASLTLGAPEKTLAAKVERHDPVETIREAFAEIERQLEAHKSILRGEPVWKRRARREELRRIIK